MKRVKALLIPENSGGVWCSRIYISPFCDEEKEEKEENPLVVGCVYQVIAASSSQKVLYLRSKRHPPSRPISCSPADDASISSDDPDAAPSDTPTDRHFRNNSLYGRKSKGQCCRICYRRRTNHRLENRIKIIKRLRGIIGTRAGCKRVLESSSRFGKRRRPPLP